MAVRLSLILGSNWLQQLLRHIQTLCPDASPAELELFAALFRLEVETEEDVMARLPGCEPLPG